MELEKINNQLEIIADFLKIDNWIRRMKKNGMQVNVVSSVKREKLWLKCLLLDATINDVETLKSYRKTLYNRRKHVIKSKEEKQLILWITRKNYEKIKKLVLEYLEGL